MLKGLKLEVSMKLALTAAVAVFALAGCVSISTAPVADEHAVHHPSAGAPAYAQVDHVDHEQQMKRMREMHQKMAAAKTPEERAALMNEHMKTMRDGMAMMEQMRGPMRGTMGGGMGPGAGKGSAGGGMAMDADMMKRRANMMEMMMEMAMDCEGMKPALVK